MQTASLARLSLICVATLTLITTSSVSIGQNAYTPDVGNVGLPSNGVFSGGSIDTVQLNNGNLHLDIPLLHLPGIGLDSDIHLTYDSQIWNRATGPQTYSTPNLLWTLVTQSRPPWQTKDPLAGYLKWGYHSLTWNCAAITGNPILGGGTNTDIDFMSYTDEDGSSHPLPVSGMLPSGPVPLCGVNGIVGSWPTLDTTSDSTHGLYPVFSPDQSGYRLAIDTSATPKSFIDKHGSKYIFATTPSGGASGLPAPLASTGDVCNGSACGAQVNPGGATNVDYLAVASIEDSNGNTITRNSTGFKDTVGRQITETMMSSGLCPALPGNPAILGIQSDSLGSTPCTVQYTDQNGNPQTITIGYGVAPVSLEPLCGTSTNCGTSIGVSSGSGSIVVPTSITLQNGDTYTLSYTPNPGDTNSMGEITSITLPTGGVISYTYGGLANYFTGRQVTSRSVTVSGQTSTWKYHYGTTTVTVTDPNLNDTVYTCTIVAAISNTPPCYMTKEVIYNGSAFSQSPIVTKTTGYTDIGIAAMPTTEILTWNSSGATTETDTTFDTFTPPIGGSYFIPGMFPATSYLTMGNVMSKVVYDYGTGAHGALLSNTQHSYLHQDNSAYVDLNILDRPTQVSVYNSLTVGASTLVAKSVTAYDAFNQTAQTGLLPTTGTTQHDYTNYSTAKTMRGLPTSVTKNTSASATVTTYTNYDDLGKPTVTTDALGNQTKYAYGAQNAFLASTTPPAVNGVSHATLVSHDLNTGLLMSQTDPNQNSTSYTYDDMMRPLTVTRPLNMGTNLGGGSTTYSYPDPNHVKSITTLDASRSSTTIVTTDGLGRKISTSTSSDAYCQSQSVETTYDLMGRVQTVSNPHCVPSAPTDGLTTYSYDAIGRLHDKMNPDGSSQNWSFNGNVIDFYDETSRHWQHTYDAEDRLIKVLEPDGSANITKAPSLETDYSYNTLGNLLQVDQWGGAHGSSNDHIRTFAYDWISRLIASNNPESASAVNPAAQTCTGATSGTLWTTCYSYDKNSNLLKKTDNRAISINYTYDALNRVTGKTYSDSTPPVIFNYDTTTITGASNDIGELTRAAVKVGSGNLAETFPYAYDSMGRLIMEQQCTAVNCTGTMYQVNTTYDYAGKPLTETFPSNAPLGTHTSGQPLTLTYGLDTMERPISVTSSWVATGDTKHPATLFQTPTSASVPGYGPVGLLNATLGVSTYPNGVVAMSRAYDARGRVVSEVDAPTSGAGSPTDSTGTITIAGSEQSTAHSATPGTAMLSVSGSDGTTQVCSYTTQCPPNAPNGPGCWQVPITPCPQVPNSGAITATIWTDEFTSHTASAGFSGSSTDASIATAMASAINGSGAPVGAVASGTTILISATSTGPNTNYPFSIGNPGGGFGVEENVPAGDAAGWGTINTFAGSGVATDTGDGGAATDAGIPSPGGLQKDSQGNIYIADGSSVIREVIAQTGVVTTVVGTGVAGFSGDGGPASSAQLHSPTAVAFDSAGNMYIADTLNQRIRKVAVSTGTITTFAGNGTAGYSGDNGVATSAALNYPEAVTIDGAGNVYFSDSRNNRIRKVTPAGTISTVAGNGTAGFTGDGGAATSAEVNHPYGLTASASGDLYISDSGNNRVRKVTASTGTITTVAGNGTAGYSGDGGSATSAKLSNSIVGVALDAFGNLFIADYSNYAIREVAGGNIYTVTGNGTAGFTGDGGPAYGAEMSGASSVVLDSANNLYFSDVTNNRVRQVAYDATVFSGALAGGSSANPGDTGTVSVMISGNVTTVPFGVGSTPTTIATVLTAAINTQDGTYVHATSSGGTISLTSLVGGTAADWNLSESVTYDDVDFASPSFTATDNGMSGGLNASNAYYSYVIPTTGGYSANGNLLTSIDSVMGQWNYTYDNLNRLINAAAPVSQPTGANAYFAGVQSGWAYDAFGNRLSETQGAIPGATPTASMPTSSTATFTPASNQLATSSLASGITYDAAGDVTYDGTNSYLYDAEGRICAVQGPTGSGSPLTGYIYDGAGIRVAKASLTSFSCTFTINGYHVTSSYVLDSNNEQVTEYSVSGTTSTWVHTNAFVGSKLLASYHDTDTYFALEDWLGTKRMEITPDGLTASFRSLPFGNGLVSTGTAVDATEHHFTDKERDFETGNDYFDARYYSSNLGRFMSPDWSAKAEPVPYAKMDDPQSLNLYAYVGNNPSVRDDPDGHAFGLDDLVGAVGGAVVGVGAEVVKDIATGQKITPGAIAGAAVGGAIMGEGIVNMPETLGGSVVAAAALKGAAQGAISNLVQQGVDNATGNQKGFNGKSLAVSTAIGAATGGLASKMPALKVPGITSGRGNMKAVAQGVATKIENGTASSMSLKTAVKGAIGGQVANAGKTATQTYTTAVTTSVCNANSGGGCK